MCEYPPEQRMCRHCPDTYTCDEEENESCINYEEREYERL